tara:strand:- start:167 stop:493 length:327 start_codon:yes stop_codon:yes gene_type:complete
MKLTTEQLKKIIKEELESIMAEAEECPDGQKELRSIKVEQSGRVYEIQLETTDGESKRFTMREISPASLNRYNLGKKGYCLSARTRKEIGRIDFDAAAWGEWSRSKEV